MRAGEPFACLRAEHAEQGVTARVFFPFLLECLIVLIYGC